MCCRAAMLERSWAGKRWEKGSVALERHYRLSPSCRPLSEITPATLAGLIIDLSDRLPYCAVVKKDLTMWQKFNTRATSCMSFKGAAAEALSVCVSRMACGAARIGCKVRYLHGRRVRGATWCWLVGRGSVLFLSFHWVAPLLRRIRKR